MKYQDRQRAEGFGRFARQYDKTRPSYPDELITWLSAGGTGTAVDVGGGTGQVALLLMQKGWKVLAIEPDPRMAAIAHTHQVDVTVTTFEQWDPENRQFDLITAGTSWHWIDPEVGYAKAASILKPGGKLAIFRNFYEYEPEISAMISQSLQRMAPHLLQECIPLGIGDQNRTDSPIAQVAAHRNLFSGYEIKVFPHERTVPVTLWIEELTTHSPIYQLEKDVADALLTELASKASALVGDKIKMIHNTHCLVAWKR